MAPRGRAARWSECARSAEHRSTRIRAIRTRGAQKARVQAGRMGVRDPATLLQQPPSTTAPDEAIQDKLLDEEGHLTVRLITIVVAAEERASVTANDLQALLPSLEMFHRRFGRFFVRSEARAWSHKYLIGLTLPIERKNVENIAEQVGAPPRKLQEFLSDSPWDEEGCIEELQGFVGEQMGSADGVLILDDTGFAKKGIWSAGVARQYSGTLGRVDNCQIGVFLAYASQHGHTLVDRRLYVPEGWFQPEAALRRKRASLPQALVFKTKLELGKEMLAAAAKRAQLPFGWVTADAAYGDSHELRQLVSEQSKWYCFEVRSNAEVWSGDAGWQVPEGGRLGRPRS